MRLQGMSIVFALVCLPIILVIAYYISLQIDTITLQNQYNANLLDATSDAMSAFELNTANEDLSTVSDSLRTIIEASGNIFMNALSTNFGMSNASKSHLEPFIPAVLYTLYDGYYIYSPTYAPTVITDSNGNAVSVGDIGVTANSDGTYNYDEYIEKYDDTGKVTNELDNDQKKARMVYYDDSNFKIKEDYGQLLYYTDDTVKDVNADGGNTYTNCTTSVDPKTMTSSTDNAGRKKASYTTRNILKSYIPYSARYVQKLENVKDAPLADLNVIYTLDNYVTIEGSFDYGSDRKIYWTKSGYLIPFTQDEADGTKGKLAVQISFNGTDFTDPLKYNQNEIQEYIEAGNPIIVEVLKDIQNPEEDYERIIEINDSNKAIIDNTNTNSDSDTVKLTQYENALFDLEELIAKIRRNVAIVEEGGSGKVILEEQAKNAAGEPLSDESGPIMNRTTNGNAIYNILLLLGRDNFNDYKDLTPIELFNKIDSEGLIDAIKQERINPTKYKIQLNSAAVYYAKAAIFSNWVKDNLSDLKINSIQDISGLSYTTYVGELANEATKDEYNYLNVWNNDGKVFDFTNGTESQASTEIMIDSSFYTHKLGIIRTSIQYNLNLAMSAYNRHLYYDDSQTYAFNKNTDYTMPVMQQYEWEQILSNISIVSFMQGLQCGLKTYNNYMVVSSTNNEIMTTPDNIYYARTDEFNNEKTEYHKYDCKKVLDSIKADSSDANTQRLSFTSKEVKYDKLSTRSDVLPYTYDHKCLACYECINDGNYKRANIFKKELLDSSEDDNAKTIMRKAFYIGVAKERNDIYKMNAVKNSEGYEVLFFDGKVNASDSIGTDTDGSLVDTSLLEMNKIKQIEITFGAVDTERRDEASLTFAIQYRTSGGTVVNLRNIYGTGNSILYSIPTNTSNKYTWNVEVEPTINDNSKFNLQQMLFILQNSNSSFTGSLKKSIVAIRIIYK